MRHILSLSQAKACDEENRIMARYRNHAIREQARFIGSNEGIKITLLPDDAAPPDEPVVRGAPRSLSDAAAVKRRLPEGYSLRAVLYGLNFLASATAQRDAGWVASSALVMGMLGFVGEHEHSARVRNRARLMRDAWGGGDGATGTPAKAGADALTTTLEKIAAVGDALDLSAVEKRLFELAVLSQLDPFLRELCDSTPRSARLQTVRMLAAFVDASTTEVTLALAPEAALSATGLIEGVTDFESVTDLRVAAVVLDVVTSDALTVEEACARLFSRSAPATLREADFAHVAGDLELAAAMLRNAVATGARGVNVLVWGPPGVGKTQFVKVLAEKAGLTLFDTPPWASGHDYEERRRGERLSALARVRRACRRIAGALVLLDEAEDVFPAEWDMFGGMRRSSPNAKGHLVRVLEENAVPTVWVTNEVEQIDRAILRRFALVVEFDNPPRGVRKKMFRERVAGLALGEAWVERVAGVEGLTPADLDVVRRAIDLSGCGGGDAATLEALATRVLASSLGVRGSALVTSDDRVPEGYDVALTFADHDMVAVADAMVRERVGRLCLYGPPGTGKSAFARYLAERMEVALHVHTAGDVLSMWVGGTERALAEAFRRARREGAVLVFDEADSFLQERAAAQRSWEVTAVNEFLTQLDAYEGVIVCTTNLLEVVDGAAMRRFDLKARFDYLHGATLVTAFRRSAARFGITVGDDDDAVGELVSLQNVTLGDFRTVERKARLVGCPESAGALVALIAREAAMKKDARPRKVGF